MIYTPKMVQVMTGISANKMLKYRTAYLSRESDYIVQNSFIRYTESGIERLKEVNYRLGRVNEIIDDIYGLYDVSRIAKNSEKDKEKIIIRCVIFEHLKKFEMKDYIISLLFNSYSLKRTTTEKQLVAYYRRRFTRIMIMDVKEIVKINLRNVNV